MHQKIYEALKQAAIKGAKPLTYADIAPLAGLNMDRADHRNRIAEILDEISTEEHAAGRPLLSAIVVHADDFMPGGGFFKMARRLGVFKSGNEFEFHAEELGQVYKTWGPKKP